MIEQAIGHALQTIGEILIAYTVLRVHFRLLKKHRLAEDVYDAIKSEQLVVAISIIFIFVGFLLQFSIIHP